MTTDEIVKTSIEEITPYAKKKGVHIDWHNNTLKFYGYSRDSSKEIQLMLMDSINKKLTESGSTERITVDGN